MAGGEEENGLTDRPMLRMLMSISSDIKVLKSQVTAIEVTIREDLVRKEAFMPVRLIVYALVAAIGSGFIAAILALIWRSKGV